MNGISEQEIYSVIADWKKIKHDTGIHGILKPESGDTMLKNLLDTWGMIMLIEYNTTTTYNLVIK